jgi:hypothetical protein
MNQTEIGIAVDSAGTRLSAISARCIEVLSQNARATGAYAAARLCTSAAIMMDGAQRGWKVLSSLGDADAQLPHLLEGLPPEAQRSALTEAVRVLTSQAGDLLNHVQGLLDGVIPEGDEFSIMEIISIGMDLAVMMSHVKQARTDEARKVGFVLGSLAKIGYELVEHGDDPQEYVTNSHRSSDEIKSLTEALMAVTESDEELVPEVVLHGTLLVPTLKVLQRECKDRIGTILMQAY